MEFLRRTRSSHGPMVVDGRTVTLHSSTWSLPVRVGDAQVQFVHAQPDRVEVLEADGRHHSRRVHDVTYVARVALGIATVAIIATSRRGRKERSGRLARVAPQPKAK